MKFIDSVNERTARLLLPDNDTHLCCSMIKYEIEMSVANAFRPSYTPPTEYVLASQWGMLLAILDPYAEDHTEAYHVC